jgi:tight adherence protein B
MIALALLGMALLMWPPQSRAALRIVELAGRGRLPSAAAAGGRPLGATGWAPALVARGRTRHRAAAQDADLMRAVRLLAQELRGGADPARAWAGAAAVGGAESGWIGAVARQAAAGAPIGAALEKIAGRGGFARARAGSVARLGAAWSCSAGSGASAAEVLDQWVGDAQARQRAAAEIDSQLAGPRASALLLGALPLLGLAMGAGMGADPLRTLFGGPVGLAALGSGVLLEIAGVLWVRRIVAAAVAA